MDARVTGQGCSTAPECRGVPVVRWDGTAAATLIAEVEACVAAGARFAVLAAAPPLGHGAEAGALLARWWPTAHDRLAGLCAGWAVLVPGADVNPGLLARYAVQDPALPFPVRTCADQAEAFVWLVSKLETLDAVPVRAAAARR